MDVYCSLCGQTHVFKPGEIQICPRYHIPVPRGEEIHGQKTVPDNAADTKENQPAAEAAVSGSVTSPKNSQRGSAPGKTNNAPENSRYVRICPRCQRHNPSSADICSSCGAYLDEPPVLMDSLKQHAGQGKYFIISTDQRVRAALPKQGTFLFSPTDGSEVGDYLKEKAFVSNIARPGKSHAVIMTDNGHIQIADLGSTNGTYVNGERIDGFVRELRRGDLIGLGSHKTDPNKAPRDAAFFILDQE